MKPDKSVGQGPIWNARRNELVSWLRGRAPSLAGPYEGAVELLAQPRFPGRVHFIAHVIRDIPDRLVDIVGNEEQGSGVNVAQRFKTDIVPIWQSLDGIASDTPLQADAEVKITLDVARTINRLVDDVKALRTRRSKFELLFQLLMNSDVPDAIANERIVKDLLETVRWFIGRAHLANSEVNVDESELVRQFERFEAILHSFVGDFFTGKAELDAILQQANR